MGLQTLRKKFVGATVALAAAALLTPGLAPDDANAQQLKPTGDASDVMKGDTPLVDAAQELKAFSEAGGVGVILVHKPWKGGVSAQYIVDAYSKKFEQRDITMDFRVVEKKTPGAAVIYLVGGVSQGPYNINQAYDMIDDIANQSIAATRLLTSDARDSIDLEVYSPKG